MDNEELQKALEAPAHDFTKEIFGESENELYEDLTILHPDGSRSCVNYELRGKGFHLLNLK
jgi:hypothetical protein